MIPDVRLILVTAGPRRLEVIVRVRELLRVSLTEARRMVDAGGVCLAEDHPFSHRLQDLREQFQELGAEIRLC